MDENVDGEKNGTSDPEFSLKSSVGLSPCVHQVANIYMPPKMSLPSAEMYFSYALL